MTKKAHPKLETVYIGIVLAPNGGEHIAIGADVRALVSAVPADLGLKDELKQNYPKRRGYRVFIREFRRSNVVEEVALD